MSKPAKKSSERRGNSGKYRSKKRGGESAPREKKKTWENKDRAGGRPKGDRPPRKREKDVQRNNEAVDKEDLIYGLHPVEESLDHSPEKIEEVWIVEKEGRKLNELAKKARSLGVLVRYRPRVYLDRLLPNLNHQGIVARRSTFVYADFSELITFSDGETVGPLLYLYGIQDPGNMGALIRSAKAFGASGVILSQRDSCGMTPAVMRASAGAAASLPIAQIRQSNVAIRELKEAGWWLLGLTMGEQMIGDFDLLRPCVFIMGAEGKGLKPSLQKHCDALLSIPMIEGWDSLNVSVSGGIAMYEWQKQQLFQRKKGS